MMNRMNTVLAVLLVVVVVMTAGVGVDYSQPNIEILPDMKYTPAWEAFAANPVLPNGRTMQPPVHGTIARGQLPLYYAATKEDAVRAGEELVNPVSRGAIEAAVDAELKTVAVTEPNVAASSTKEEHVTGSEPAAGAVGSLALKSELLASSATKTQPIASGRFAASVERGSKVYLTYCISCHGPKGAGDGPVPQRGFPPPPSMLTGKSLQMKDGQLFHILTYGQSSMAPFAAQLSRDLRWDVINYVRDLQSKAPPPPVSPSSDGDATPASAPTETPLTSESEPETTAIESGRERDVEEKKLATAKPNIPPNASRDGSTRKDTPAESSNSKEKEEPANDADGRE